MAIRVKKKAITLHFREDKPTAYKLEMVKEQTVKYKQLCRNIANNTGIRKGEVEDVLDGLITQMVQMMELGHTVQLGELGSFKPTITTKCKDTMGEVGADNIVRRKILFYPGEAFKTMLADMEIETESDDEEDTTSTDSGSTDSGTSGDASEEGGQEFT